MTKKARTQTRLTRSDRKKKSNIHEKEREFLARKKKTKERMSYFKFRQGHVKFARAKGKTTMACCYWRKQTLLFPLICMSLSLSHFLLFLMSLSLSLQGVFALTITIAIFNNLYVSILVSFSFISHVSIFISPGRVCSDINNRDCTH